jgi:hypothetical protein
VEVRRDRHVVVLLRGRGRLRRAGRVPLVGIDEGAVRGESNAMHYPGNGTESSPGNGTVFPETQVTALAGIAFVERERGVNGGAHTFAIRGSDGAVLGWGINSGGEVGDGTREHVTTPLLLDLGGVGAKEVRCTLTVCAALREDGRLYAWGGNTSLQATRKPTAVPGVLDVEQLHLTWGTGFALTSSGAAYMWETSDDTYHPRAIVLKD